MCVRRCVKGCRGDRTREDTCITSNVACVSISSCVALPAGCPSRSCYPDERRYH